MILNFHIYNKLFALSLHLGHSIYTQNLNTILNKYFLGIRNNYYIFNIKKIVYSIKNMLFFIELLTIKNKNLLFYYSEFYLCDIHIKQLIVNLAKNLNISIFFYLWMPGTLTNYKICFLNFLNLLLKRKRRIILYNKSSYLEKQKKLIFKYLFLRILFLTIWKSKKTYNFKLKMCLKYWRLFLFLRNYKQFFFLPDACFFINQTININLDFYKCKIPIISLIDSNSSTKNITYPIFSNDDSLLICLFYFYIIINTYKLHTINYYINNF